MTPVVLLPKIRSADLMASARGQQCSVRLPLICNHSPDTVVTAHLPGIGKGMGTKGSDLHSAFACQACHDVIDGRRKQGALGDSVILDAALRGHAETQARWIESGLLIVPSGTII